VHGDGVGVDVALWIEIAVELAAGGNAVDDLDAAKLDQAISAGGIESGRFRVKQQYLGDLAVIR
jgi:hypothetical protein